MGYTKDALRGISWIGSFRIVTRVISFLRTAIVARILNPSQVGTFGIIAFVLSFSEIITETGINILLIQQKEQINKFINTAYVVSIIRGFIISLLIVLTSQFIATFYNDQALLHLLLLTSLIPVVRGFINPSIVKFLKELNYKKEFYYRTSIFAVESIVTLVAVFILKSTEALVIGLIFGAFFEVVLSFVIATPRPELRFDKVIFRSILKQGKWLTTAGLFNFLYHNGDDMVVGKMLGTSALGVYEMAYKLSMLPITEVGDIVTRSTFPVFTKFSDDKQRLKKGMIKMVAATTLLVLPLGLVLILFPRQIIEVVLGSQWVSGASILQVLAVFGVIRAISYSTSSVFLALKRQDLVSHITLASLIGMGLTIVPFISLWGLPGAAASVLFGTFVALPVILFFLRKVFRNEQY